MQSLEICPAGAGFYGSFNQLRRRTKVEYRAVENRCAVILDSLGLSISREETLTILNRKGFAVVAVNIISLARRCIGTSQYRRGARLSEAPAVFDCSSFTKWLYGKRGIWLPPCPLRTRKRANPCCIKLCTISPRIASNVVLLRLIVPGKSRNVPLMPKLSA